MLTKCLVTRHFTTFKTALPKAAREGGIKTSDRNINKQQIHLKGKSHSSTMWLDRQLRDPYYIRSKQDGYRSRAVYKLKEIDDKYHILHPGSVIVDVGAAPGSWSQYCTEKLGVTYPCSVISIDLLAIEPLAGAHFIQGDFLDSAMKNIIRDYIGKRNVDVVISDIAPNFSGDHNIDHTKQIAMCLDVIKFAQSVATMDCCLVMKVLQGSEFKSFVSKCRDLFKDVSLVKPNASRKESTEIYCVLRSFK